jgi:hypothetical protein
VGICFVGAPRQCPSIACVAPEKYVIMEPADLEKVRLPSTKVIDV